MPDNRRNLQVNQPGIQGNEQVDKNGWPTPLSDPSNPLKMKVTHGTNGSQKNFDATSTSCQDDVSCPGGNKKAGGTNSEQGGHGDKFKTSQQNARDHSTPESERSQ